MTASPGIQTCPTMNECDGRSKLGTGNDRKLMRRSMKEFHLLHALLPTVQREPVFTRLNRTSFRAAILLALAVIIGMALSNHASAETYSGKVIFTCGADPSCSAHGPRVAAGELLTIEFASCFVEIPYAGAQIGLGFLGM